MLDALSLVRGAFIRLPDYKLETAAQTLLGRGKLIAGDDRHAEIERLYRNDPQRFVDYNLEDARLVTDILARTGLIELAVERSLLTGMPLDRVSAAIASVDSLYLGALRARGRRRAVGGPQRHRDAAHRRLRDGLAARASTATCSSSTSRACTRASSARSISIRCRCCPSAASAADALTAPNGARFRRDERGILPALVEQLADEREQARARRPAGQGKRHQDPDELALRRARRRARRACSTRRWPMPSPTSASS